MVIVVNIRGVKRVNNFLIRLTRNTEKEVKNEMMEFNKFVQKSAKLRAPRDTGDLAKSINVRENKNQIIISVDSPYGIFQEKGFRPHWVHADMPDRRGNTIGSVLNRRGFIYVRNFKPFIIPALESALTRLPMMSSRAVEKAVAKSR